MKTCTASLEHRSGLQAVARKKLMTLMTASMRDLAALAVALLAGAAIITLSIWLASQGALPLLGAGAWALGFVFIAQAVDSEGPAALRRAAIGCALPVLALLQDRVSADFLIVAGVMMAVWIARALMRKLSAQVA